MITLEPMELFESNSLLFNELKTLIVLVPNISGIYLADLSDIDVLVTVSDCSDIELKRINNLHRYLNSRIVPFVENEAYNPFVIDASPLIPYVKNELQHNILTTEQALNLDAVTARNPVDALLALYNLLASISDNALLHSCLDDVYGVPENFRSDVLGCLVNFVVRYRSVGKCNAYVEYVKLTTKYKEELTFLFNYFGMDIRLIY